MEVEVYTNNWFWIIVARVPKRLASFRTRYRMYRRLTNVGALRSMWYAL